MLGQNIEIESRNLQDQVRKNKIGMYIFFHSDSKNKSRKASTEQINAVVCGTLLEVGK